MRKPKHDLPVVEVLGRAVAVGTVAAVGGREERLGRQLASHLAEDAQATQTGIEDRHLCRPYVHAGDGTRSTTRHIRRIEAVEPAFGLAVSEDPSLDWPV